MTRASIREYVPVQRGRLSPQGCHPAAARSLSAAAGPQISAKRLQPSYQASIQFEMAGRWVITIKVAGPVADAWSHDLEVTGTGG